MRLLVCAGGTGGGVYPALAVLQTKNKTQDLEVLWVGSATGIEADLVQRASIPFHAIPSAGVHGVGIKSLPGNLIKLLRGFFASRQVLKEFNPDVIFYTGGYVGVPMALAGQKRPSVAFVPDIEPAMALNQIIRNAKIVAVTCEKTKAYIPANKRVVVSGYPTRPELSQWNLEDARSALNLNDRLPVLFVFGGSKGARSINRALLGNIRELVEVCQIIHVSGQTDWEEIQNAHSVLPNELKANYHIYPYLHEEMGAAFTAADLVICRSGASTLGELPLFALPAILVPYPYAWRYQKTNADYLAEKNAAIIVEDQELSQRLAAVVKSLLNDNARLNELKNTMQALAKPDAAEKIAALLFEAGNEK